MVGQSRPPQPYFSEHRCPDGSPFLFTGCLTPVSSRDDCRCVNAWTNRAPGAPDLNPSIGGIQNDGRISVPRERVCRFQTPTEQIVA